jgi:hypothetical protein
LPATGLSFAVTFLVAVIAFGMLGLLAMAPALRTRRHSRAAVCDVCRRNHRRWVAVSGALAGLTLVGAGLRLAPLEPTVPVCPVTSISSGTSQGDLRDNREDGVGPALHRVLTGPVNGLAIAYARWQRQTLCDAHYPSTTVVLIPYAGSKCGGTFGDVFVTPCPNIDAWWTQNVARHEAKHSDQWAALTALGGIMTLPVAYAVDESMYPSSLNHFEEAAGLADGEYPPPPIPRPGPRPWALIMWCLVTVVVFRTRLRLLFRTVAGRPRSPAPERCGRHTPGW